LVLRRRFEAVDSWLDYAQMFLSGHARLTNKNPRRITSGGNGNPFFGEYAGSARSGSPFEVSQRMTLGRSGFGGVSICLQPVKAGAGP
jgi:hypothetical protein